MAPKGKQAVFKKKVYVYMEFFPLTGNTQTSGLQQDIVRISALGGLETEDPAGRPPAKIAAKGRNLPPGFRAKPSGKKIYRRRFL